MHLISARAERAYSRSILKRLKMSQTRSSANTFQIHTKNIASDNTHLRFSSHRAHKIEEEIQVYSHPRVHFRERTEEEQVLFARDASDKTLSSAETTHISASHHAERMKLKKKRVDVYYHQPSRVHFCECTEEERNDTSDKNFQKRVRFLAQRNGRTTTPQTTTTEEERRRRK